MKLEKILKNSIKDYKKKKQSEGRELTRKELSFKKQELEDIAARTKKPLLKLTALVYKSVFPSLKTSYLSVDFEGNPLLLLDPKKAVVYISSHVSNLDSLVIGIHLYTNKFPYPIIAAGDNLFKNKLINYFYNSFGAFKLKRANQNKDHFDLVQSYLKSNLESGQSLLYFPEGTRSRDGQLGSFKQGLTKSILKTYFENKNSKKLDDILFVPLGIAYSKVPEDIHFSKEKESSAEQSNLFKDFFNFRKDEIVSYMRVGKPISLNDFFNDYDFSQGEINTTTKEFSEHIRQKITETTPILQQDVYHYAIDHCLASTKTDTIHFKRLRSIINSTYSSLQGLYGPRMINAKESMGEFLSRMHKRELILKDKLKITVKNKEVIKYYANKIASVYKHNRKIN